MRFDVEGWLDDTIGIADTATSQDGHPELVTECPYCGGVDKLWANARTGKWVCYSCRAGGALPSLVAVVEGCSHREAVQFVAATVRRSLSKSVTKAREAFDDTRRTDTQVEDEPAALELPDDFVPVFDREAWCWNLPRYMVERGIRPRTALSYGLGFCRSGRYGGRLILPAHQFGDLVFFQGRAMGAFAPKYLSPAVAGAGGTLYGLDEAVGVSDVLVVEGPLDVVSLAQRGYNAVSLLGKELSRSQANKLHRAGFTQAVLLMDGDAIPWGATGAETLARIGIEVLLAKLPPEHDPDSAPDDVLQRAIERAAPPTLRDRRKWH